MQCSKCVPSRETNEGHRNRPINIVSLLASERLRAISAQAPSTDVNSARSMQNATTLKMMMSFGLCEDIQCALFDLKTRLQSANSNDDLFYIFIEKDRFVMVCESELVRFKSMATEMDPELMNTDVTHLFDFVVKFDTMLFGMDHHIDRDEPHADLHVVIIRWIIGVTNASLVDVEVYSFHALFENNSIQMIDASDFFKGHVKLSHTAKKNLKNRLKKSIKNGK